MFDQNLCLEALSALVGAPVKLYGQYKSCHPDCTIADHQMLDIKTLHKFTLLSNEDGETAPFRYSNGAVCFRDFCGRKQNIQLPEETTAEQLMPQLKATFHLPSDDVQVLSSKTKCQVYNINPTDGPYYIVGKEMFVDESQFFDPPYDYDLTNINDNGKTFYRGGEEYRRPCGWYRYAVKVLGKYEDGDRWLGVGEPQYRLNSASGEWPVSYHGTSEQGSEGILSGEYRPGPNAVHGRGVYSSPDIRVGTNYAKSFSHNGKTYKIVLQNRVNPETRKIIPANQANDVGDYWLIPEGNIMRNSIRPYGLLLSEV
ncbi:UNVERIFIED_CONTAM: hypothetical protein FKN15_039965 [Acipenser sinensis]